MEIQEDFERYPFAAARPCLDASMDSRTYCPRHNCKVRN